MISDRISRYELKYIIDQDQVNKICRFIAPFCSFDKHSEKNSDGYYHIKNLYLDSPSYVFIRNRRMRLANRFNMRIRSYSQDDHPMFLEIKQKSGDIVRKFRSKTRDSSCMSILAGKSTNGLQSWKGNKKLFYMTALSYNVEPKILVQYSRMAFVSTVDFYARVTFDKHLTYYPQSQWQITTHPDNMIPMSNEIVLSQPNGIILELKCIADQVPIWMLDLIEHFDLERVGFSKYLSAINQVIASDPMHPAHREIISKI